MAAIPSIEQRLEETHIWGVRAQRYKMLFITLKVKQTLAVQAIDKFLKSQTSYDVSTRFIQHLSCWTRHYLLRKSLNILLQNNIVSATTWDAKTSRFAGLLNSSDFININTYGLKDVERAMVLIQLIRGVFTLLKPLYDACVKMIESRSRKNTID
ncbi:Nuclear protein SNF4 [Cyberlindnera fabianii]|uniref:Nuclear protein SNF4 n=1 Tax=Cyberlindnera fabianii TaxID=36022 RepID=A0A1V2L8Y3_CYBFA|nr:Nuclear protein SNF4 [Cyberlindnera fabianii]